MSPEQIEKLDDKTLSRKITDTVEALRIEDAAVFRAQIKQERTKNLLTDLHFELGRRLERARKESST